MRPQRRSDHPIPLNFPRVQAVLLVFADITFKSARNLPDEAHGALPVRATRHGRSTEAEVRAILEEAVKPEGRVTLGSQLVSIAHDGGIEYEDLALFERERLPTEPVSVDPQSLELLGGELGHSAR